MNLKSFTIKNKKLIPCSDGNISIITEKEATDLDIVYEPKIKYSKVSNDSINYYGTILIPSKSIDKSHVSFSFALNKDKVVFIDNTTKVQSIFDSIPDSHIFENNSSGNFFSYYLKHLIRDDISNIIQLESSLETLEDMILEKGYEGNYNHQISKIRRKVVLLSHYYLQIIEISNILSENYLNVFTAEDLNRISSVSDKASKLHSQALMLRDYSIQVREVYQSVVNERQKEIMKILTIVTTIVLPLSLIAGWYGMNFVHMPELRWRYGYPAVILLSIAIVVVGIYYFKKKKFW